MPSPVSAFDDIPRITVHGPEETEAAVREAHVGIWEQALESSGTTVPAARPAFDEPQQAGITPGREAMPQNPPRVDSRPALPGRFASTALHDAVRENDPGRVAQLIGTGDRPNRLDDSGRTPLDLLDERQDLSPAEKTVMRDALLRPGNPTAPGGHRKWEAGHGTPWGLEIISDGALRGGVNDAKGGRQSLEGKVFFSDRTAIHPDQDTTRADLRSKPRVYARGKSDKPSGAANRAIQHRYAQAISRFLDSGGRLDPQALPRTVSVAPGQDENEAVQAALQAIFTKAGERASVRSTLLDAPATAAGVARQRMNDAAGSAEDLHEVGLPESLAFKDHDTGQILKTISGSDLVEIYKRNIRALQTTLETGKAPLLALINKGDVVPLVFGFEKLDGLQSHAIHEAIGSGYKRFSYKNDSHPLEGDASGGRLREVEVPTLGDLATLHLGMLAKRAQLPDGVVFRVNPPAREKSGGTRATYLSPADATALRDRIDQRLGQELGVAPEAVAAVLPGLSLQELQELNQVARQEVQS